MNLFKKYKDIFIDEPNKLSLFLLGIFSFTLPLYQIISTLILLLLVIVSVIKLISNTYYKLYSAYTWPILLYFIIIISLLVFENFEIRYVQHRASLIAMPLVFCTLRTNQQQFEKILLYFVNGSFVSLLICYGNAFYNSISFSSGKILFQPAVNNEFSFFYSVVRDGNYFFSSFFSILHDSTYMAIYINFAITIILSFSLWKKNKIYLVFLFLFILCIFQLSSKIAIFITFVIICYYFILKVNKKSLKTLTLVITISVGLLFFSQNPRGKVMIDTFIKEGIKINPTERFGYALRLMSWDASIELVKEYPLTGVGISNVQKVLNVKYQNKSYTTPLEQNLNSHNQYLQIILETGISGFILIILMQLSLFKKVSLNKIVGQQYLILMFLFSVSVSFLFESMFNRYSGLVFFMFIYCMIINNSEYRKI